MKKIAIATTLFALSAVAHDMWIEPSNFSPRPGEIVSLRLLVGQEMLGDPLPRSVDLIKEFVVDDGSSRKPVVGREGVNPAGFVRIAAPGMHVVGYRSNPTSMEQSTEKFNRYLQEEGLAGRIEKAREGVVSELFSRCAKSLILVDSPVAAPASDRVLGFTLELVAERNPFVVAAGEELPVRITYEGRSLAGALVVAMSKSNSANKISARSDADGRVRFRLNGTGAWMIKAVHMVPAPSGSGAKWHSYWASLTFERR